MLKQRAQAGFSLLELAIVLLIVGLLLGGLIIGVTEAMATLYGNDITDFLH